MRRAGLLEHNDEGEDVKEIGTGTDSKESEIKEGVGGGKGGRRGSGARGDEGDGGGGEGAEQVVQRKAKENEHIEMRSLNRRKTGK